jgi:hypothetical protein
MMELARRLRGCSHHPSGRPWVAILPLLRGGRLQWQGSAGTNAGEILRDHGLIPLSGRLAWSLGKKSPQWSADRRGILYRMPTRCRRASPACLYRVTIYWCAARRSAPSACAEGKMRQAPAASANNAGDGAWLFEK